MEFCRNIVGISGNLSDFKIGKQKLKRCSYNNRRSGKLSIAEILSKFDECNKISEISTDL
jgi:hypothetical protein